MLLKITHCAFKARDSPALKPDFTHSWRSENRDTLPFSCLWSGSGWVCLRECPRSSRVCPLKTWPDSLGSDCSGPSLRKSHTGSPGLVLVLNFLFYFNLSWSFTHFVAFLFLIYQLMFIWSKERVIFRFRVTVRTWNLSVVSSQREHGFIRASVQTVNEAVVCTRLQHTSHITPGQSSH